MSPLSLAALAAQYNLPIDVLIDRLINQGWDLFLALVAPADLEATVRYIGINGKAYYSVDWSENPVTTRQIIERYVPHHLPMYDLINSDEKYTPYHDDLRFSP